MFFVPLIFLYSLAGFAVEPNEGFYFDSQSKQYFASGKPKFSIRPIGNEKYIKQIDYSLDGEEFKPFSSGINFTLEGSHTIRFRATDPVNNWSPIQSYRIFVDLTPPRSSVHWLGPKFEKKDTVFVHPNTKMFVVAQDNLSGVSTALLRENENITKHDIRDPIRQTGSGVNSVEFAAVDNVGNQEKWQKISYIVDGDAPRTLVFLEGIHFRNDKELFVNRGTQIRFESKDDSVGVDRIDFRVNDAAAIVYGSPFTLTESENKVAYRAIDYIGNIEPWLTENIRVDTTAPTLEIGENGNFVNFGGKVYAQSGYRLSIKSSDSESGLEGVYIKRNKGYQKADKFDFTFAEQGEHQFHAIAKDRVDNVAESKPYVIYIDNKGPSTSFQSKVELVERDGVFLSPLPNVLEFSSKDDLVGVDRIEASYDGTKYFKLDQPIDLTTWKHPKNDIYYRSVDRLGNVGEVKKITVQVLTQGPAVGLFVESKDGPDMALSDLLLKEQKSKVERKPAKK